MSRPRAAYKIACVDCGGEFTAKRKHAKYDPTCKALRQALAVREFPIKCPGHHDQAHYFYRLDGFKPYCIACCLTGIGKAPKPMTEQCERCEAVGTEFYPGSPVCIECVQRADQPHAAEVTRWLLKQRQERLSNSAPVAAVAPTQQQAPPSSTHVERIAALTPAGTEELDALAQSLLAGELTVQDYRAIEADILRRHSEATV